MGLFSWFKSSKEESTPQTQQPTWDPNTLTMQQPSSPAAPTTERVITEQPTTNQENQQMKLRGGGAGDVCCGACAGILCFECCEECC